jgi:DNA-directed RNA polymerase specialized sigma24 family protein
VLESADLDGERFRAFVLRLEPRLHAAFVAVYGHDRGREATAEALAYAWEHWTKVEPMTNPLGYLYRVGQSRVRRRKEPVIYLPPAEHETLVEPNLLPALASLPERQRAAVVLVHVEGWTLRETGELMRLSIPTVQKHVERGMVSLRRSLRIGIAGETR